MSNLYTIVDEMAYRKEEDFFSCVSSFYDNITWPDIIKVFNLYVKEKTNNYLYTVVKEDINIKNLIKNTNPKKMDNATYNCMKALGFDFSFKDYKGTTFLQHIFWNESTRRSLEELETIKKIIVEIDDPYFSNKNTVNILFLICEKMKFDYSFGYLNMFNALLSEKPPTSIELNKKDDKNQNILNILLRNIYSEINLELEPNDYFNLIQNLIEKNKVSFNHKTKDNSNILVTTISDYNSKTLSFKIISPILKYLIENGVSIFEKNKSGESFFSIILSNRVVFSQYNDFLKEILNPDNHEKFNINNKLLIKNMAIYKDEIDNLGKNGEFFLEILKKDLLNDISDMELNKKSKLKI